MPTTPGILLISATVTTALMAGLFYSYSCSVSPGLNRLSDASYLAAMQSINRAIMNPVFFVGFFGAAVLLPLSAYSHYGQPTSTRFWCVLTATVVYMIGVLGVTVAGNVPLNEALDAFDLQSASARELAAQRAAFEMPWSNLNRVRTIASTLALLLVVIGLSSENK